MIIVTQQWKSEFFFVLQI